MMINQHGIPSCVRESDVADAYTRGLRLADDADLSYLEAGASTFKVPDVQGFKEGGLTCPVAVIGCGPSRCVDVAGAFHLAVNPRHTDTTYYDGILALDPDYWQGEHWAKKRETFTGHCFSPKYTAGPEGEYRPLKGTEHDFTMPMQVHKADRNNHLELRVNGAIKRAHYSSIAAVLVARYLTSGPVIVAGCDLSGTDAKGESYADMQTDAWEAAAGCLEGVYSHPDQCGPLALFFPTWEGN